MLWHDWLYAPLFNLLVYLYTAVGADSLGTAIIALTLVIRVALLPLSFLSERSALAYDLLQEKIRAIEAESSSDPVFKKERVRALLKKNRVSPWAKVAVLAVQLLVLIVLYQVFLGGINKQLDAVYPWIQRPEVINTIFFGFEIGERSIGWAATVGLFLLFEIGFSLKRRAHVDRSDLAYLLLFPFFVFCVLWYLPMVKSLFILTSLLFSLFLGALRMMVFETKKKKV
jgi:YidC/Oxa1 family membrane protein insertase